MVNKPTKKIEELNLIALRQYACPKVSNFEDWYLKCLDCPGLEDCRTGKRARDILDESTLPQLKSDVMFKRLDELEKEMKSPECSDPNTLRKYIDALRTNDPVGYLVDGGFYPIHWRARYALQQFAKKHDIPIEKRLLYANAPNPMESTKDRIRKILAGTKEPEDIIRNARKIYGKIPCFATLYEWIRKYPDVVEGYPVREAAQLLQRKSYTPAKPDISEKQEPVVADGDTDGDEVSVVDFLKENPVRKEEPKDIPPNPNAPKETVIVRCLADHKPLAIPIPDMRPIDVGTEPKFDENENLRKIFVEKHSDLTDEIARIQEGINIQLNLLRIKVRQKEALEQTAVTFGFCLVETKED